MGYSTKSCRFALARSTYVTVGDNHAFERTNSFSISFWTKWLVTGVSSMLVAKQDNSSVGYAINSTATGQISVVLVNTLTTNNIDVVTTATGFNNGAWHHICVTYSGTSTAAGVIIYVDGSAQTKTTTYDNLSASIVTTAALYLGARVTSGSNLYLTGNIDEVAFYNATLSASDVTAIYNQGVTNDLSLLGSAANLVGWWRMGDGDTFPTLTDYGSGAHNGTMTSMIAADIQTDAPFPRFMTLDHTNWRFKTNLIQPYSRKCLAFTAASNQYVTMGNVLSFDRTTPFSISAWVKTSYTASNHFLVAKGGSPPAEGYWLLITAAGLPVFTMMNTFSTNDLRVRGTTAVNNGVWHHVCATHNGTGTAAGVKIYVDGVESAYVIEANTLTSTIITTASLRIGTRENGFPAECFNGSIDEVSIYDSALSAAQVTALYNGKATTNLLKMVSPAPSGLLGWWRTGDGDTAPTLVDWSTGGNNGTMVNSPVITSDWPTTGNYTTDHQILLRNIKNALIDGTGWTDSTGAAATLSTPWTVVASSNGTVANTSDNWNVNADIVFAAAGTAHSWIILRQTGINGLNYEVCLDCKNSQAYSLSAYVSFTAGFDVSTPTTARRPTAPDEWTSYDDINWFNSSTAFNAVLNFAVTNDGQCTRWWGLVAGANRGWWLFDRPKNTVAGWTDPAMYCMQMPGPIYTSVNDNAWTGARINGINVLVFMSAEFYNGMAVGQAQTTVNSVSSEWPMNRVGISCAQAGRYGRQGEISDLWWTSTTPVAADTFPASAPLKQFIVIPNMVHPWNRSTPVTT